MSEGFPSLEEPQAPEREISGFEAVAFMFKAAAVIEHFVETKQGEIRSLVENVQKGTKNPLLVGDVFLNATTKFMHIVGDYQIETEKERAGLQNDTILNIAGMEDRTQELDKLKQGRGAREAVLHNAIYGAPSEAAKEDQGVSDEELMKMYEGIDLNKELSAEEEAIVAEFNKRLTQQLDEFVASEKRRLGHK